MSNHLSFPMDRRKRHLSITKKLFFDSANYSNMHKTDHSLESNILAKHKLSAHKTTSYDHKECQ